MPVDSDLVEAQNKEFIIQTSIEDLKKPSFYRTNISKTASIEEAARNGLDSLLALQNAARRLEDKLVVTKRWTETCDDWKRVDISIAERDYRKAIDRLEGLVVARLFELSKMNQAGTGEIFLYSWYPQCISLEFRVQATDANI